MNKKDWLKLQALCDETNNKLRCHTCDNNEDGCDYCIMLSTCVVLMAETLGANCPYCTDDCDYCVGYDWIFGTSWACEILTAKSRA